MSSARFAVLYVVTVVCLLSGIPPLHASSVDPVLETELDHYIVLAQQDEQSAGALLQRLAVSDSTNPALQSRVRLLGYLAGDAFFRKQHDQMQQWLVQLLALAAVTEDNDALGEIYATELELLLYQKQLNSAMIKTDIAQHYLARAQNPRVRYYGNNVLGRLFMADNQYEQALQHFISALEAVSETNDGFTLRRRSFLSFNIARVQTELKNWPQARAQIRQLIADAVKYEHNRMLPELYLLLGYVESSDKQFTEAERINYLGLNAALQNNQEATALVFENNLGAGYIQTGDYVAAKAILLQAQERATRLNDEYSQQLIMMNLGYIRVMAGEHDAGIAQMQQGMQYFGQHAAKAEFEPYYEWLAKAFAAAGRYQEQADTLLEQMALREDIRIADRESRLSELQDRYDSKAKAQQITILQQENALKAQLLQNQQLQQRLSALVAILVLCIAAMLFQLYRKVRNSNRRLHETNKQLAFQSQRDPLTGLYNRRALQQHMQLRSQQLQQADTVQHTTGLLLLDIDFFKRINDQYGHNAGDAVLIDISRRLQATCREHDLVVRWGGEEILLLLDSADPAKMSGFIYRVLQVIAEQPVLFDNQEIAVTASGGFVHLPFAGIDENILNWEKAIQIVDMALYLSKANGRNQVCLINGLTVNFDIAEPLLYTDLSGAIRQQMVDVTIIAGAAGTVS